MRIKNYWMMLAIALAGLCTISCGGDDDEDVTPDNNGNTTEVTTDYTVTTTIKTVTLYIYNNSVVFYQDYNNRYSIILIGGTIQVCHSCRSGEGWTSKLSGDVINNCGIEAVGKVSNLTDIVSKDVAGGSGVRNGYGGNCWYEAPFQPNYGYSIMFTTEEAEQKYMRVYAINYALDYEGVLQSVTIQYQLY